MRTRGSNSPRLHTYTLHTDTDHLKQNAPKNQKPKKGGAGCVGDHIIGTRHERFVATWSTSEVDEKEVHPDPGQIADLATGWVLYLQTADAVYTSTLEI